MSKSSLVLRRSRAFAFLAIYTRRCSIGLQCPSKVASSLKKATYGHNMSSTELANIAYAHQVERRHRVEITVVDTVEASELGGG